MRMAITSVAVLSLLAACATPPANPDTCELRVVATERWQRRGEGVDAAYRVRGRAGAQGTAWLAARSRSGTYVSGYGVAVSPGRFDTVVELELDALPEAFVATLQVPGRRCFADAPPGPDRGS